MFIIIKPVKQEEDFIDIHIYKIEPLDHIYHRVFETEQEIYLVHSDTDIYYWLAYDQKFCTKDFAENLILYEFDHICIEFWFSTKELRLIGNP